ncbi:MAG TPA: N-acetylneuraminate synthase [Sporosarcina psychrophila]|uniref:N-acetylneuraminate synthase n=1 Tax=Sporosarcina psychrophila TaxID=1476 RepID=A0A921KDL8_SPOPS|nr:N-acetylneuraminate synthase [Sporosarcina psychrophila]
MKTKTFIIAEAGVNHNGSLKIAKQLVDVAVKAGADAVKFQTFISEKAVSTYAEKADYQKRLTDKSESQLEMVKKLELSFEEFKEISNYCESKNILFLSTAFDLESLVFLDREINIPIFKIPSGEITNGLLMLNAAKTQKSIILSTGMSTLEDIDNALAVMNYGYLFPEKTPVDFAEIKRLYNETDVKIIKEKVSILHCTTEYPAPFEELNLKAIQTLSKRFGTKVGLSDHSNGIIAPIAAVALGAEIIEKHFTLDNKMLGPDHQASLEPPELKEMIDNIRKIECSLGDGIKKMTESEKKNYSIARKSLVAEKEIVEGEILTSENVGMKRPGNGMNPLFYWEIIGRESKKTYKRDEPI